MLKKGDSGERVEDLQRLLIQNGASLSVDGSFGEKTFFAVKRFQLQNGLVDDGIVGPKTWEILEDKIAKEVTEKVVILDSGFDFDARTERNLGSLDPKAIKIFEPFIQEAKKIAAGMGYEYIAISGNRGESEQNAIYAQGRSKPGKVVTNARYPYSNHNHRIALDFGVFKNGKYVDGSNPSEAEKVHRAVSKLCDKYQIDWGGNWTKIKDYPHFEVRLDLSIQEKIKRMKEKGTVF